ncbi:MAG: hypothetical protein ABFR97_04060 [Thermodesulfobacteriota bacterium]
MIRNVTVYLDNEQLEFNNSVRCGFIVAQDERGEETFHNDLIDSADYHDIGALVSDISGLFAVRREAVMVAA